MIQYGEIPRWEPPKPFDIDNISMAVPDPGRFGFLTSYSHDMLAEHYYSVKTPLKPPNRQKFGTLEIFVSGRKEPIEDKVKEFEAIASSLNGVLLGHHKDTARVAFPLVPETRADSSIRGENAGEPDSSRYLCYRMDVTVCSSPGAAEWKSFMRTHGDFCNLLGSIIRPFGLLLNDDGFFVSFAPNEDEDSPETALFLVAESYAFLHFLGLPAAIILAREFDSLDTMFRHITACSLALCSRGQQQHVSVPTEGSVTDIARLEQTKSVFRAWYEVFLPAEIARKGSKLQDVSREKVVYSAIHYFGVAEEFESKRAELTKAD